MRLSFKRKPKVKNCTWIGCWGTKKTPAVAIVITARDCGHSEKGTYTCQEHIEALHFTGGTSKSAAACSDCGKVSFSKVLKVEDLDV